VPRNPRMPAGAWRWTSLALATAVVMTGCSHKAAKTAAPAKVASSPSPSASPTPPPPPPTCPLTGIQGASVPNRPALAIKIENSPDARPQVGLDSADVIYEEPVEGGITRFIVEYQCHDAARVEPVRSIRQADPYLVNQSGKSLFGNASGSPPSLEALAAAVKAGWLVDVGYSTGGGYLRDSGRAAPHNLYTSTPAIYARPDAQGLPMASPIFTYSASPAPGGAGSVIHAGFSANSDVYWRWSPAANIYQRYYGTTPANGADGHIMASTNVIVMSVPVQMSWWIEDPSGSHQPIPQLLGTGAALVCRAGTCVSGNWWRPGEGLGQVTYFNGAAGHQIPLVPGNTWVELVPSSVTGPGPIPVGTVSAS
jgi:hypothetical protein